MRNESKKIIEVVNLIRKRAKYFSGDTNLKIGLKIKDLDKLKIKNEDLKAIFLMLEKNGQIKILNDLIFDFNGLIKKISQSVSKELFGKKGKKHLSSYDAARLSLRIDKEYKRIKENGEIQISLVSLDELNDFKKKLEIMEDVVIHRIEFKNNRKIILDGKIKLSKPDFYSENDNFFNFVYNNSNRKINISEIEAVVGKLKKRPVNILADLGFKGDTKKMFFPAVSAEAIMFINPITKKYLKDNNLKKLKLDKE